MKAPELDAYVTGDGEIWVYRRMGTVEVAVTAEGDDALHDAFWERRPYIGTTIELSWTGEVAILSVPGSHVGIALHATIASDARESLFGEPPK